MESLKEMTQFLDPNARIDLKDVALQYVRGLCGSKDGVLLISNCKNILEKIILLTKDTSDIVRKEAIICLINISAEEKGALALVQLDMEHSKDPSQKLTLLNNLLDLTLDSQNKTADGACKILCNVTRVEDNLEYSVQVIYPKLPQVLDAFTNITYNPGSTLDYLGPLLSNLSGSLMVRQWLCEEGGGSTVGVSRVASFCQYQDSRVRRGGAAGTLRNICFDVNRHDWLLGPEIDLLPYILLPLAGGEEFSDDVMDTLPPSLQYLPSNKQREQDPDIRILLLEALSRLCIKKPGREFLRNHGTYYILRELHKWEKDRKALLWCENVVDILIKKEDEMGAEDITAVNVPSEYQEKFRKMDEDFINDA